MTKQYFNLLYEPCIPIEEKGRVPLLQIFEDRSLPALSGTPLQKIALMKFLLAIAQAAGTPADLDAWLDLGPDGLSKKCIAYLQAHEDCFWLYGARPFLQMPACEQAEPKAFAAVMPEVAFGNTTLLTQFQLEPELDDADKLLLLLVQMSLCLGGKKPYNKLVLSPGYEKKTSARPGPGICHMGLLHSFLLGGSLQETLWFNILTLEDIKGQKQWTTGLGTPPWEIMPQGEACPIAEDLKNSLMGRLIPMARFCLLSDKGLRFTSGIDHLDYTAGMADPSIAVDTSKGKTRVLWTDPEKRPWRQLPALLAFLDTQTTSSFYCLGLQKAVAKVQALDGNTAVPILGIWSGGVKVSSNAGEQYLTGRDDMVESVVWISPDIIGYLWFSTFAGSMEKLEKLANLLYATVNGYHTALKADRAYAAEAAGKFWQMAEHTLQKLIIACDRQNKNWSEEALSSLFRRYHALLLSIYDEACPHETARQLEAWVRNRPFSGRKHG